MMRSLFVLLILILSGLSSAERTFAETPELRDQQGVIDYLVSRRDAGEAEFRCSGELYNSLRDHDFRGLYHLLVKAGFDYGQTRISYNDFRHLISLSGLLYAGRPWRECYTLEDVKLAFRDLRDERDGFMLLCGENLIASLIQGTEINYFGAENGFDHFSCSYSYETGVIRVGDIVYFDRPYAEAQTAEQFAAVTGRFADQGINDFYVIFSPELFSVFVNRGREQTILLSSARLTNYQSSANPNNGAVHFSSVEFTNDPRELCYSIDDVRSAVSQMAAAGIGNFELIFPDTAVYHELAAGNFALLQEIEASAGMTGGNVLYSSEGDRIIIENAVIVSNAKQLQTPAEAAAYAEARAAAGDREIHLFCTPELYRMLMGDLIYDKNSRNGMNPISDLITHAGIFEYATSTSDAAHVISIRVTRYYSGKAIMQAVWNGGTDSLSEREKRTLDIASSVAGAAQDPDPLLCAKYIHDWICDHVVYTVDDWSDEDDTAVGAILNGQANCDGYADAFYLIGSLAGLHVRYQHGDSYNKDLSKDTAAGTHVWNLLKTGEQWHMVDVTWDDEADGKFYIWFNVGRDIAGRLHYWNESMTVPLAETTERRIDPGNEYYIRSEQAYYDALETAAWRRDPVFHFLFEDPALSYLAEDAKTAVSRRSSGSSYTYSWNDKMFLLSFYDVIW